MQQNGQHAELSQAERMFLGLAEQLCSPFLQIAHISELARTASRDSQHADWQMVSSIAGASLQLVQSYALSLRVHASITPLTMEPVTISSLLYDTAHYLEPFAKQYGIDLELEPGPRVEPVLADRTVLQSAMTSLGQVFVQAESEIDQPTVVRLAAHRSRYGIVAGLYGSSHQLGADSLRRAHAMQGTARQPLQRLVSGPAAGVFVADSLLQTLAARLHVARYHNLNGLAATLMPSQQMQLV